MNQHATQIIEALGDTAAVARMFGIRMPSVSEWKRAGIPPARLMYLEAVHKERLKGIEISAASRQHIARKPRKQPATQEA